MGALGVGAAISYPANAFALSDTTSDIRLEFVKISIPDLPVEFLNYRIGFLTDIHLGVNIPDDWVEEALRMLSASKVDLLLLGGDYIAVNDSIVSRSLATSRNAKLARLPYEMHPSIVYSTLGAMVRDFHCADGVCGVFGNHDLWVAPKLCINSLSSNQVKFLVNDCMTVLRGSAKLVVVGFDDYWNGVPHWPKTLADGIDSNEVRIALAHNPDQIATLLSRTTKRFSLGLCGHTHGGQIAPPGIGPLFFNVTDPRFGAGLLKHLDGSVTYTSRGLGVVEIPYRINCPAEVTVLELQQA